MNKLIKLTAGIVLATALTLTLIACGDSEANGKWGYESGGRKVYVMELAGGKVYTVDLTAGTRENDGKPQGTFKIANGKIVVKANDGSIDSSMSFKDGKMTGPHPFNGKTIDYLKFD